MATYQILQKAEQIVTPPALVLPNAVNTIQGIITKLPVNPFQTLQKLLMWMPYAPTPKKGAALTMPDTWVNSLVIDTTNQQLAPLEITGGQYTGFNGQVYTVPRFQFDNILISVEQAKNLVVTNIQGSDNGGVVEYVGLNNYEVTLTLIIPGVNGEYPQETVNDFLTVLTAPISLKVASWYLLMNDIHELVIKSNNKSQVAGGISQQQFTVNCISNITPSLIIT